MFRLGIRKSCKYRLRCLAAIAVLVTLLATWKSPAFYTDLSAIVKRSIGYGSQQEKTPPPIIEEFNNVSYPSWAKVLWTAHHLKATPRSFQSKLRYPECFIIGARKAGTTALQVFLANHPQIWTRWWEDGFFSREDFYPRGLYIWLKPFPVNKTLTKVVKVAEYFHLARVPPRMQAVVPTTKFILIVKDPVNRTVSDYLFLRRYSKQPYQAEQTHSFQELVYDNKTKEISHSWPCITRSLYDQHFENWLQWFPREQFLVIDGEEFIRANPAKQLQRIEKFLNLKPFFHSKDFCFNETKGLYCDCANGCLGDTKGHLNFMLPTNIRQDLAEFFKPHNKRFFDLVGNTFKWDGVQ